MKKADKKVLRDRQEAERSRFLGLAKTLTRIGRIHPCEDERIKAAAYCIVRFYKYGLMPLAKDGQTLAQVRNIIVRRYAPYLRSLEAENRRMPTLARFERVCMILRDAIMQSVAAKDLSYHYSRCDLEGLRLLAEGVTHKVKKGAVADDRLSASEQHRIVGSVKLVCEAYDRLNESVGVTVSGDVRSFFKMSGLVESLQGLSDEERYHKFLFRGDSGRVVFNPEGFRDEIERQEVFYKQLSDMRNAVCPALSLKLADILNTDLLYGIVLFTLPQSREAMSNPIQCLRDLEGASNKGYEELLKVDGKKAWESICAEERKISEEGKGNTNEIHFLRQQKMRLLDCLKDAGVAVGDLGITLPAVMVDLNEQIATLPNGALVSLSTKPQFLIVVLLLKQCRSIKPADLGEEMEKVKKAAEGSAGPAWCKYQKCDVRECRRQIKDKLENLIQQEISEDCRLISNSSNRKKGANWSKYFRVVWRKDGKTYDSFPYDEYPERVSASLK